VSLYAPLMVISAVVLACLTVVVLLAFAAGLGSRRAEGMFYGKTGTSIFYIIVLAMLAAAIWCLIFTVQSTPA
jgi:hypothetical protein